MKEAGVGAVKLEGGKHIVPNIKALVDCGIPVMGHVGMTPQSVNIFGGYRSRGRTKEGADEIVIDAKAVADAGAFSLVIESTIEPIARSITEQVAIPTIGIGASPTCDGQVLVAEDLLGIFNDFTPRFVERYADLGQEISSAVRQYADDVRSRTFPTDGHCYGIIKK